MSKRRSRAESASPTTASSWWRQLDARLWAGRSDDRPTAKNAAIGPIRLPRRQPDERATWWRIARLVLVLVAVIAVLAVVWFALRAWTGG